MIDKLSPLADLLRPLSARVMLACADHTISGRDMTPQLSNSRKVPLKRLHAQTRFPDKTQKVFTCRPAESDNSNVILLDADMPHGMTLRSQMQARGIIVHLGPDSLDASSSPIIVVNAENRKAPQVELRMAAAKSCFGTAPVGYALPLKVISTNELVNDSLLDHLISLGVVIQLDFPSDDVLQEDINFSNGQVSRK
jgi:hypothetical protein